MYWGTLRYCNVDLPPGPIGCLPELGELPQKTLAGESACPTWPHKRLILRGGAGASACQRTAKDDESPFRLSTRRGADREPPTWRGLSVCRVPTLRDAFR